MDSWCNDVCPTGYCPETHCIRDSTDPTTAPVTTAPVTTAPVTTAPVTTEPQPDPTGPIRGYYQWSWTSAPSGGPSDTNACVFFSGWNNVDSALGDNAWDGCSNFSESDDKYFSIGGGNNNGILNASTVQQFIADLSKVTAKGFNGVMWDIEKVQGSASAMNPVFSSAFAAVKNAGLKNAITVSHTAPYDCDTPQDAVDFVKAFVQDANVDIISPQLYTSGWESQPDFAVTGFCSSLAEPCGWNLYQNARAGLKVAPSIATSSQYDATKSHLKNEEQIETSGYFVWQQSNRRLDIHI